MTGSEPQHDRKARGGRKAVRAPETRRPPRPPGYFNPRPGICHLCQRPIYNPDGTLRTRAHWHPECARLWRLMNRPAEMREFVFLRDNGKCCDCPAHDPRLNGEWDVDHDKRLTDSGRNIAFWHPSNTRTRCRRCHRLKTALENSACARKDTP